MASHTWTSNNLRVSTIIFYVVGSQKDAELLEGQREDESRDLSEEKVEVKEIIH